MLNIVPVKWGTGLRLLIGSMPSEEDVLKGEVFSDGTGRILDMLLRKAGIRREEITMITLINYHSADGKFPTDQRIVKESIRNHVMPVLKARPWQRADLVGEHALKYIGLKRESVSLWRGSPIDVDLDALEKSL